MIRTLRTSVMAITVAAGWALPAQAQNADNAAIQQELAAMRAQMVQMSQRIDTLQDQLAVARSKADSAAAAVAAIPAPTPAPAAVITWDGAPRISQPVDSKNPGAGTWSFKPRGRLQVDTAGVNAPAGIPGSASLGIATEIRRAYIGAEGTIPGGFGYRADFDLANSSVEITDLYLTYKPNPKLTLTLGQHKAFWGLEELTSDLFTSFMERAAFNSAFGFERRVGLSAAYAGTDVVVQGGVFADNAADLNLDTNNSYSVDGRVVFMPKLAGGQLHLGVSGHYRTFNDVSTTARYRARPLVHTTDVRLVDTKAFSATGERSFGGEAAFISGRFHATAETHFITALRPGLADPTFNGGYGEVGLLLTDDTTAYKGGVYDRIKPKASVGKGGIGAVQLNARYDWLDLNDAGIVGGRQQVAGVSLLWMPTDYVRFIVNYGHLWIEDAAVAAGLRRDYQADSIGMRAQLDF
ncbi:MAG TPA: porin [Novosphingobium sp.]|nr:porin [Novosphingobium sp.]